MLLLNEPTNHLDIISSEILIAALADFQCTLLIVSHNQSFINRLATKIWDIREGSVLEYPGTLDEYYDHLCASDSAPTIITEHDTQRTKEHVPKASPKSGPSRKVVRRQKAQKRGLISATLKPIQDALSRLEERISGLENREKELEKILAEPEIIRDKSKYLPLLNKYGEVKEELEALMLKWEHKQDELGSAKRELEI